MQTIMRAQKNSRCPLLRFHGGSNGLEVGVNRGSATLVSDKNAELISVAFKFFVIAL